MSAILYPVATNAERALADPVGRAARQSEAQALARGEVRFVTEAAGPAFASYEEAAKAFAGRIDEGRGAVQPQDRYCSLREVAAEPPRRRRARGRQSKPVFRDGRRWSPPPEARATVWRLSVSYWRIVADEELAALEQARAVRRKAAEGLDPATLQAMAGQPLKAIKPQQPLDIGLFEQRLPENPDIVIPDE
jgi:hypothetical protein